MELQVELLPACPVCARSRLRTLMKVPDFETATGEYGLMECADCGLAFTNPRPLESELPALYADRTTADFPDTRVTVVKRLRDYAIDSYLKRELGSSQLLRQTPFCALDFGCGDGALALGLQRHARARGAKAQVTAVDFHNDVPASLAGADPKEILYFSYDNWRRADERYDAVFLRHVLEHHQAPKVLLAELCRVLQPKGRLFIEVPNRRSVWARVFGRYYSGYYIPRHLMHFDIASLRTAVESSGMRCLGVRLGHTPLLGRSLGYLTGWNIGNLGLLGLASYPVQVVVDLLARTSSTLTVVATPND